MNKGEEIHSVRIYLLSTVVDTRDSAVDKTQISLSHELGKNQKIVKF